MNTCKNRETRRGAISLCVLFLVVLLAGCDRKSPPVSSPSASATAAGEPVAELVLTVWQQGDQSGAVSRFVETDWSKRPLFAPGSGMSLSEERFVVLPASDREAKSKEILSRLSEVKNLGRAVAQAGRDAVAKQDRASAVKHFTALQQFGAALDTPDSTKIVRMVGQALKKTGDDGLLQVGQ